jgi:hypothetical protein
MLVKGLLLIEKKSAPAHSTRSTKVLVFGLINAKTRIQ